MPDKEMPKEEFELLQESIEDAMETVDNLQKVYFGQTGRYYVRPLRLAPRKERYYA